MDIFILEINGVNIKQFSTLELAKQHLCLIDCEKSEKTLSNQNSENSENYNKIRILHEEYIDDFNGSDNCCRLHVVYEKK